MSLLTPGTTSVRADEDVIMSEKIFSQMLNDDDTEGKTT
jgi:hypothetical protein